MYAFGATILLIPAIAVNLDRRDCGASRMDGPGDTRKPGS